MKAAVHIYIDPYGFAP